MKWLIVGILSITLSTQVFAQNSDSDPQGNRQWLLLGLINGEIGLSLASLASFTDWGPDANGWIAGFEGGVLVLVSTGLLTFTDWPVERKLKLVPGLASGLIFCALSYYQFNGIKMEEPGTRALYTFAGYQAALLPIGIQTIFYY